MSGSDMTYSESGRLLKMEVDYSATVDEKLPVCEKLTSVSITIQSIAFVTMFLVLTVKHLIRELFSNRRRDVSKRRWTSYLLWRSRQEP